MEIDETLNHMNFALDNIFKFEKLFFSFDVKLINKNNLKYQIVYLFDEIIKNSSKGVFKISEFNIPNKNQSLFNKDNKETIRVIKFLKI